MRKQKDCKLKFIIAFVLSVLIICGIPAYAEDEENPVEGTYYANGSTTWSSTLTQPINNPVTIKLSGVSYSITTAGLYDFTVGGVITLICPSITTSSAYDLSLLGDLQMDFQLVIKDSGSSYAPISYYYTSDVITVSPTIQYQTSTNYLMLTYKMPTTIRVYSPIVSSCTLAYFTMCPTTSCAAVSAIYAVSGMQFNPTLKYSASTAGAGNGSVVAVGLYKNLKLTVTEFNWFLENQSQRLNDISTLLNEPNSATTVTSIFESEPFLCILYGMNGILVPLGTVVTLLCVIMFIRKIV